ncbi:DUF397 domain-containing protein [Streptomyces sedi]|uniref:DUF397 domain-containing protein n=1 Tax=Streptomyces sedi TaxID=555059 RepID=A0A5C4VE65_9ACTN|nr:DUF397 domain-containing protein [Streptomyces sedi]TNM34217.1 DUF397 domain-containing protein [Streptomyces sedi]
MTRYEYSEPTWRRSSYSGPNGGECLEVADGVSGMVPVRDSKDVDGPTVAFPAGSWAAFLARVKR